MLTPAEGSKEGAGIHLDVRSIDEEFEIKNIMPVYM